MILYLETSDLVKLYVRESGSEEVEKSAQDADIVATSVVAYPEARAAFARKWREKGIQENDHRLLKKALEKDWHHNFIIYLTEDVAWLAGDLAEKYGLRGFDAIHLASAMTIKKAVSAPVIFSSADTRLNKAAVEEGLTLAG